MTHFETIRELIADHLCIDPESITPDSTLGALGADSLDVVEIAIAIDEAYGIEIPDEKIADISTIADIITHLETFKPQPTT